MNLDDIMNENIEDVVRVSVMERVQLSDYESEPDDEEIPVKAAPEEPVRAKPAAASQKKAEPAQPGKPAKQTGSAAEPAARRAAEESVSVKQKAEPARKPAEPAPKRQAAEPEPAYRAVPVNNGNTAVPSGNASYQYDDDDDDDDDYVVRDAFGDDEDVKPARKAKPVYYDDADDEAVARGVYGDDDDGTAAYDACDDDDADEAADEDDEYEVEHRSFLRNLISDYLIIPIAFIIALVVFYVFPPYIVDGPSMQKTLDDKAFGFGFRYATPERGDIVIVNTGNRKEGTGGASFIKRVIAVPGDTIECVYERYDHDVTMSDGSIVKANSPVYRVYLNGELLYEPYAWYGDTNIARVVEKRTLGEDEYFVMGDNRFNSNDSRAFGPISRSDIKCTMMFFMIGKHNPE